MFEEIEELFSIIIRLVIVVLIIFLTLPILLFPICIYTITKLKDKFLKKEIEV